MSKKVLKDGKGMALVVVLLVLLVFTILFAGAIFSSNKNVESLADSRDYTAVYYQAESGINCVVDKIFNEEDTLLDDENLSMEDFVTQMNQKVVVDDCEMNEACDASSMLELDVLNKDVEVKINPVQPIYILTVPDFINNAKIIFDPSAYTNLPDEFLDPIIELGINPVDSSLTLKEKRQGPVIEE